MKRRIIRHLAGLAAALTLSSGAGAAATAAGAATMTDSEPVHGLRLATERDGPRLVFRVIADAAQSESRKLSGSVRMTTAESAARAWVIPAVAKLRETMPDIEVEIVTTDKNLDIAHGEADFAIRFGPQPDDPALVVRRLADLEECVFASRELVARYGRREVPGLLSQYPLVVESSGVFDRFTRWLVDAAPGGRVVQRVNSLSSVIASVRSGIGAALLPTMIGDNLKGVARVTPPIEELTTPCWLVTTDQARRQPHVRATIDCVTDFVIRSTRRVEEAPAAEPSRLGRA